MQDWRDFIQDVVIPEDRLQARIAELGKQISEDYADKEILIICILRGGVMFMSDLLKYITCPVNVEFMAVSSYGVGARQSTGNVRITLDLNTSIRGRDVLIVEDIIDSGFTLASVVELLQTREPASLFICTLLDKFERREIEVPIRYVGFPIKNQFVFGYGLDIDEYYRNLPFIGAVDLSKYVPKH